jgi:hypothetical protein
MFKNDRQEYGACFLQKHFAGYHGEWIMAKRNFHILVSAPNFENMSKL